jgi:cytochrome P450
MTKEHRIDRGRKEKDEMDVDLYAPDFVADPWPTLSRIRDEGPIVWNKRGYWMSARDRVCRRMFANPQHFSAKPVIPAFFGDEAFIAIDDKARHNELRMAWAGAFRREKILELAATVRRLIDDMLHPLGERLKAGDSVDMVQGLCRYLPGYVIATMLGIPKDMHYSIVRWSEEMVAATITGYDVDYTSEAWLRGEKAKREGQARDDRLHH